MAKNKKTKANAETSEPIALDVQLSKGEAFIEKNWKTVAAVIGAVIVVVLGTYLWRSHMSSQEAAAQNAIAAAQSAFAAQRYEQAINGDSTGTAGFLKVIDEYSGTKTANLAKLYAGISYDKLGKTDEAIKMLEGFDTQDDLMISPASMAALGNLYIKAGNNDKGVQLLVKAAEKADNEAVSPAFLLQAGQVYESMGQNDKAVELYNKVKKQYFQSPIANEIDKYIERATK